MQNEVASQQTTFDTHNPPILSVARRLEQLYQEMDNADHRLWSGLVSALEQEIAATPASSLREAAIQMMLASAYIEHLREDLVDDVDGLLDRMSCLLRSALNALVRDAGVDLSEYAGERYAPSHTDPFQHRPLSN